MAHSSRRRRGPPAAVGACGAAVRCARSEWREAANVRNMVVLLIHVNRAGSAYAVCADRLLRPWGWRQCRTRSRTDGPHAAIFPAVKTRARLWQNVVPTYTCAPSGPMAIPLLGGWSSWVRIRLSGREAERWAGTRNGDVRDEHQTGERYSSKLQHRTPLKVPSRRDLSHVRKTL